MKKAAKKAGVCSQPILLWELARQLKVAHYKDGNIWEMVQVLDRLGDVVLPRTFDVVIDSALARQGRVMGSLERDKMSKEKRAALDKDFKMNSESLGVLESILPYISQDRLVSVLNSMLDLFDKPYENYYANAMESVFAEGMKLLDGLERDKIFRRIGTILTEDGRQSNTYFNMASLIRDSGHLAGVSRMGTLRNHLKRFGLSQEKVPKRVSSLHSSSRSWIASTPDEVDMRVASLLESSIRNKESRNPSADLEQLSDIVERLEPELRSRVIYGIRNIGSDEKLSEKVKKEAKKYFEDLHNRYIKSPI